MADGRKAAPHCCLHCLLAQPGAWQPGALLRQVSARTARGKAHACLSDLSHGQPRHRPAAGILHASRILLMTIVRR